MILRRLLLAGTLLLCLGAAGLAGRAWLKSESPVEASNPELKRLLDEDQKDRERLVEANLLEKLAVELRDMERRSRAARLLEEGKVRTGEDHYHAAFLFQHGTSRTDYERAFRLALRAAELGHADARWLSAAAEDRWLVSQGMRQKYGTQATIWPDGRVKLMPVDPSVTDAERRAKDCPPLAEAPDRIREKYGLPRP